MGVVLGITGTGGRALSFSGAKDRIGGSGSGEHSCIKDTLITASGSCHGHRVSPSTVQLVRFSLHEHHWTDSILFHNPSSTIAEVCLIYLNFGSVRDPLLALNSVLTTMPPRESASICWG